jgi:hypothetical protein
MKGEREKLFDVKNFNFNDTRLQTLRVEIVIFIQWALSVCDYEMCTFCSSQTLIRGKWKLHLTTTPSEM